MFKKFFKKKKYVFLFDYAHFDYINVIDGKSKHKISKDDCHTFWEIYKMLHGDSLVKPEDIPVVRKLKKVVKKRERELKGENCHCQFCEAMRWTLIHNKDI